MNREYKPFFDIRIWLMTWLCLCILGAHAESQLDSQTTRLAQFAERLDFGSDQVDIVWLGESEQRTLALYTAPAKPPALGAVVVILDTGQLANSNEFARSMRTDLSAGGWGVLIIQTELMREHERRELKAETLTLLMQEAAGYLNGQGLTRIVAVAQNSAAENLWPLIQQQKSSALGFVGVDHWIVEEFAPLIPVLNVVNTVKEAALIEAKKRFAQVKRQPSAPCEIYFYDGAIATDLGYGAAMSRRIRGWLDRHFNPS